MMNKFNNSILDRRDFIKTISMGIAASAFPLKLFADNNRKRQPNVLLILTDDQGSVDMNCYGSTDLYTPNMDRLAESGIRFTQFYVMSPVCGPSRAALLTGKCPQRAGLALNPHNLNEGLPPCQITIAEMLKPVGYKSALFGKWHQGAADQMSPTSQGFDEFLGHKEGCIDNYSHYFYWNGPNRHDLWKNNEEHWEPGVFFPDIIVREACEFLDKNKSNPFFLQLAFNNPHYPMQPEEKYCLRYKNLAQPRQSYAAFVSSLDDHIGKVIDKLDELNLREDTIIILFSDNGHSVEERNFFGGGSAGLYRGYKYTLWEGGLRMPCIISWPGHIKEHQTRSQLVTACDIFPTIARYCGVNIKAGKIDGKNISDVIDSPDAPSPHKAVHWMFKDQWAVRQGDWKLVINGFDIKKGETIPAEKVFLSNFDKDVSETVNLADKFPDIVRKLTNLHEDWLKDVTE